MKRVILMTVPHSGTHTMMYLLHRLGGLPVWWIHFEERSVIPPGTFNAMLKQDKRDTLFVQLYRDRDQLKQSYINRAPKDGKGEAHFNENWKVYEEWSNRFPADVEIDIGADDAVKTNKVKHIFKLMEANIPPDALTFMKTWKKMGSYDPVTDTLSGNTGFLTDEHWNTNNRVLQTRLIKEKNVNDIFKGENDGT